MRRGWIAFAAITIVALTGLIELSMGRLPLGPDGRFGFWEGSIWSIEQSQRMADPYSLTHVVHGALLFGVLWLVARRLPLDQRFVLAVLLEAGWELLENSPIVIDRYRAATIAIGYEGDSVLNSTSDVVMMALGFLMTSRLRWWLSVAAVVAIEVGCLLWVRDNLTLNIVMLVHPVESIKAWQMAGAPLPPR